MCMCLWKEWKRVRTRYRELRHWDYQSK
ncbi:MAG: hypothetical protein DIU64_005060 [Caldicoprobacter oshimai]|nr:hypothetical protein [Caldicoprobacter faecalis]